MRKWGLIFIIILFIFSFLFYRIISSGNYSLHGLHPSVQKAANQLVQNCLKRGISIQIVEGFRSIEQQNRLYAQGRTAPGSIITYAQGGESYHNYGLAVDFALIDTKSKQLSWDTKKDGNHNGVADWQEVVQEAKKLGFAWGGDWEGFKDYPHLEMSFNQSIGELLLKVKFRKWLLGIY